MANEAKPVAAPAAPAVPAAPVALPTAHSVAELPDEALLAALGVSKPVAAPAPEGATPPEAAAAPAKEVAAEPAAAAPAPPAAAPAEGAPKEEAAPEEEAQPPRKLLTEFAAFDEQGALDPQDLADRLTFSFKGNGKQYEKVPADKVVLLAQMGLYNEEREQRVKESTSRVQQSESQLQDLTNRFEQFTSYTRRLFEEPEQFEAALEEYRKVNSPEQRATRAEARLREVEDERRLAHEENQRAAFTAQVLYPTVARLLQQFPTVSQTELIGRYTELTAPLQVRAPGGGVTVPLQRLGDVQRLVETELSEWARQRHTSGELERQKAGQETQRAKRALARAAAPPPASAAPLPAEQRKKSYASVDDFLQDMGGVFSQAQ